MKPSTAFTAFAGSYFVLVMWRDGTLGKFVGNLNTAAQTVITGLKPITRVG